MDEGEGGVWVCDDEGVTGAGRIDSLPLNTDRRLSHCKHFSPFFPPTFLLLFPPLLPPSVHILTGSRAVYGWADA